MGVTTVHLLDFCIPDEFARQVVSRDVTDRLFSECDNVRRIMDLGCGTGSSLDYFRMKNTDVRWVGLDIEESPEVAARRREDGVFCSFDGVNMPFRENTFDLVFCNQVLEHVRQPGPLINEVRRVLKPRAHFIGSVSHLEPYHSYSFWNYTPYALSVLIEDAGLTLLELRPSIDALTLIIRRGLRKPKFFYRWWRKESPLNVLIHLWGRLGHKRPAEVNAMKLLFCGQFCFWAQKIDQGSV